MMRFNVTSILWMTALLTAVFAGPTLSSEPSPCEVDWEQHVTPIREILNAKGETAPVLFARSRDGAIFDCLGGYDPEKLRAADEDSRQAAAFQLQQHQAMGSSLEDAIPQCSVMPKFYADGSEELTVALPVSSGGIRWAACLDNINKWADGIAPAREHLRRNPPPRCLREARRGPDDPPVNCDTPPTAP